MDLKKTVNPQFPKIVLASGSPRRKELLHSLGLPFEVRVSNVDESFDPKLEPSRIVEDLSYKKATHIANAVPEGLVIGSDTIVVIDGQVLGKPKSPDEAISMLTMISGRTHTVYTGVGLIDAASGQSRVEHRSTEVSIKSLSLEQIRSYVSTGEPMDKAGSYAIQGIGATLVEKINGDYFTVVGLPLALLSDMLSEFGVDVLSASTPKVTGE